jgi:hypothetical protein
MKQRILRASGFMLVEAVIGVALFAILACGVLRGVSFIAQRIAITAQRHKALCAISGCMRGENDEIRSDGALPYTHSSVKWYRVTKAVGSESLHVYRAQRRGIV